MTRLIAATFALATLVPASASAEPAKAPAGCTQMAAPVYDMTRRYIPGTVVRSCPTATTDVTTGANAIKPGEVLSITLGRYQERQPFLVRGRPNVAYPLPATRVGDVAARHVSDGAYYPLTGLGRALPFQPTEILAITGIEEGRPGMDTRVCKCCLRTRRTLCPSTATRWCWPSTATISTNPTRSWAYWRCPIRSPGRSAMWR